MRRLVTSLAALAFGFLVTLAAIALSDRDSDAREDLGALDATSLIEFCVQQYGPGMSATPDGRTSTSWMCRSADGATTEDIDLDMACSRVFSTTAFASTDEPDDPFSLRCYAGERP